MSCPTCNGPLVWEGKISQGELRCARCDKDELKSKTKRATEAYMAELKKVRDEEDSNCFNTQIYPQGPFEWLISEEGKKKLLERVQQQNKLSERFQQIQGSYYTAQSVRALVEAMVHQGATGAYVARDPKEAGLAMQAVSHIAREGRFRVCVRNIRQAVVEGNRLNIVVVSSKGEYPDCLRGYRGLIYDRRGECEIPYFE